MVSGQKFAMTDYLVNVGPHPLWGNAGWEIAFDFGRIQVSIGEYPGAFGVEAVAKDAFSEWELINATPEDIVDFLGRLVVWLGLEVEVPSLAEEIVEGELL